MWKFPDRARIKRARKRMRKNPSIYERRMTRILRRMGVTFEAQRIFGNMIVDFYVPTFNTVIEVDGCQHELTVVKDARRDAFLRSHGFNVLRLPARELKKMGAATTKVCQFFQREDLKLG